MKYDKRTVEAFRRLNAQLRARYYESVPHRRFLYAFPVELFIPHDSSVYELYVNGRNKHRRYCVGIYLTKELLRAGVETVAEFLEEVM